ncbi:MAG: hypothetical protein ACQESE_01170 [Nanobdellota archaeon]
MIFNKKKASSSTYIILGVVMMIILILLSLALTTDVFGKTSDSTDSIFKKTNEAIDEGNLDSFTNNNKCSDEDKNYYSLDNKLTGVFGNQAGKVEKIHREDLEAIKKYLDQEIGDSAPLEFTDRDNLNDLLVDDVSKEAFCPTVDEDSECDFKQFEETFQPEEICG